LRLRQAARQSVPQILRRAEDAGERRAQLVRDVREQRRADLVELEQLQVRGGETHVGLAQLRGALFHLRRQGAVLAFDLGLRAAQRLGISNHLFLHARLYRRAREAMKRALFDESPPRARSCRSLPRPVGADFDAP
jgi:hypothetical protein